MSDIPLRALFPESAKLIERQADTISGLEADLRNAVLVAYRRGATEWAVRNYPQWAEWLKSCDGGE